MEAMTYCRHIANALLRRQQRQRPEDELREHHEAIRREKPQVH